MDSKILLLKNSLIINDDLSEYADAYVFPYTQDISMFRVNPYIDTYLYTLGVLLRHEAFLLGDESQFENAVKVALKDCANQFEAGLPRFQYKAEQNSILALNFVGLRCALEEFACNYPVAFGMYILKEISNYDSLMTNEDHLKRFNNRDHCRKLFDVTTSKPNTKEE